MQMISFHLSFPAAVEEVSLTSVLSQRSQTSSLHTAAIACESVQLLVSGALASVFLGGLVVLGLIVPLAIESFGAFNEGKFASGRLAVMSMLSGVLLLAGGFILRQSVLAAGVSEAEPFMTAPPVYSLGLLDYGMIVAFSILLLLVYGVGRAIQTARKATA